MNTCFMKNPLLIFALAAFCLITTSCGGNGAHQGKDTVKNVYGSANDTTGSSEGTIDTSKVSSADNSASGGTKAMRDTGKQHAPAKNK